MRLLLLLVACAAPQRPAHFEIPVSSPEAEGIDGASLVKMTEWLRDNPAPIFSLLISRNGKLVYELYTSSFSRDDAHYLMSVTKSFVSALVGIAVDDHLLTPEASIADSLPPSLFASEDDRQRFRALTLKDVMGMSALDSPDPPRDQSPAALERLRQFHTAPNRLVFALRRPLLPEPGVSYQYNDVTPMLAIGLIEYASGKSALEFADEKLFGPLGFRNQEWMHQDPTGLDNGGYGLRVRPIDMQKLGILFLDGGMWRGRRIISSEWVARSFSPWIRSNHSHGELDYGWFWWAMKFAPGWQAHAAKGWKGQKIVVLPEQKLVVTMTGCFEDNSDDHFLGTLMRQFIIPALTTPPAKSEQLLTLLEQVRNGPSRLRAGIEPRMIPSAQPKGVHRRFNAPR